MKIGVISDTHGDYESVKKIFENIFTDTDLILHAGDILNHGPRNPIPEGYNPVKLSDLLNNSPIPIHFCKGNCDSDVDTLMIKNFIQAPYLYLNLEGIRMVVTHGDKNFDYFKDLAQKNCDLLISGHTHNYLIEKEKNFIMLNPGSPSIPKNHHHGTCATIDIDTGIITIYDIEDKNPLIEFKF